MNILVFILIFIIIIFAFFGFNHGQKGTDDLDFMVNKISWDLQSSIRISLKDKIIYIDPYKVKEKVKSDMVLITHAHQDHLSVNDLKMVANPYSKIIAPANCANGMKEAGFSLYKAVKPGDNLMVDDFKIEVVPAYNPGKHYHPKSNQWVGYVLDINGIKIYHPGDTGRIPEMKKITCDIAFMPLGQTYTMNSVQEAVDAILDVKAKIAIPFHYGYAEGKKEDAQKFQQLLKGKVKVIIK